MRQGNPSSAIHHEVWNRCAAVGGREELPLHHVRPASEDYVASVMARCGEALGADPVGPRPQDDEGLGEGGLAARTSASAG